MDSPLDILDSDDPYEKANMSSDPAAEDDKLAMLIAWFEDSEEATEDARKGAERDRDYYDNKQITSDEKKELNDRGQPDIIINRIKPKIDYLMGYEAVNRTDPKAFPRTPNDEEASAAATDALRYIKDATQLEQDFSQCWENLLIEGLSGIELTIKEKKGRKEIVPVRWDWDRIFYDPHSRRHDFSDARYVGGILWLDVEEAKSRWPDSAEMFDWTMSNSVSTQTYEDRPNRWVSKSGTGKNQRKRILIVQIYYKEGREWHHCTFCRGGVIETIPVPFIDQDEESWCPLLLESAYIDRQNNRYGLVRVMIGVQDEINKRRSKALHRSMSRQVIAEIGAVEDVDDAKKEMSKPDGIIEVTPNMRFELLGKSEDIQTDLTLLQEAKSEIETMGPNAALLGRDTSAPSGKAIQANQASGQTEIALLEDRHRHLKRRVYQRIWDLIRQYKDEEWWVRVTDDEKNIRFVGFNRPVTIKEEFVSQIQSSDAPDEAKQQQLQQFEAQLASDPYLAQHVQQVARIENVPSEMFMDITIGEVRDVANIQEEQFATLASMAPAVTFPPEIYIEASSLRNKEKILEIIKNQQNPPPDPVVVEMEKIKFEQLIEKTQAEIEKLKAEALKARVEADKADAEFGMIIDPQISGQNSLSSKPEMPPPGNTGVNQPPPGNTGVME